jgi:hypothetical protein
MTPEHRLIADAPPWPEVAFCASRVRMLAMVAGSVAFSLLAGASLLGILVPVAPWSKSWLAAWGCVIFFALCALLGLRQALTDGPIVSVGPQGVRDTRISTEWIPWSAITGVSATSLTGTRYLVLRLDPGFEATMSLTWVAYVNRRASVVLGREGHAIHAVGLSGNFRALQRALDDGLARSGGR